MSRRSRAKEHLRTLSNLDIKDDDKVDASELYSPVKSSSSNMLELLNEDTSIKTSNGMGKEQSDSLTSWLLLVLGFCFLGIIAFVYFVIVK